VVTYALLRWHFRRDLPLRFDETSLPSPASVVPSHRYFVTSIVVLVSVLVGYFVAPLVHIEPYVIAFGGAAVLAVAGAVSKCLSPRAVREVSWGVFPFVAGLFVAVRAVENLGFSASASDWIGSLHSGSVSKMLTVATITAVASNAMNNLPAALLMRSILHDAHVHARPVFAALVGANAGSIVTPFGSLATMLVIALARRDGVKVSMRSVVGLGAVLAPVLVVLTTLTVAATFAIPR
jgi:arsenical pump membrane protein